MCDSLWLQYTRLPCLSLSPGVCSNSCPLSRWCYLTISSSAAPFFCLQSFSASGSFSKESALGIRWPKYWTFSFSINPSNEYSRLIFLRVDWFDLLAVQGTLKRMFFSTIWNPQFFSAQSSLWSSSHIYTWLLEKLWLWLYRPLSAKSCLCFLMCCLGLS